MNQLVSISTALCLPAPDIEALIQGQIIAALPWMFIRPGQQFALYPADSSAIPLSTERYYRSSFLDIADSALTKLNSQGFFIQPKQMSLFAEKEQLQLPLLTSETVSIQAWARCELCQIINDIELLAALSSLTIWTKEALQETLKQRQNIFLAYLRIYYLPKAIEIPVKKNSQFVVLPQPVTVSEASPVLNDRIFNLRKHQLETRQPPLHPELEDLQSAIASLTMTNLGAKELDRDIKVFLGWSSQQLIQQPDPNLAWSKTIAGLGDRSIELEEKKSAYKAGTDFENIARSSLEFLGFKVENAYKGGAGGLDLFCSKPYPLVGECKAGKLIPSGTVEELIKLGGMHLGAGQFLNSAKLVIGPGTPSPDMLKAAKEWKVSIINAMTLQKLIELKAKYPGAINLVELKLYLEPGQIDYRIDEYIQKAEKQIHLRSHLVQLVKNYLENTGLDNAGVDALHGVYFGSKPPQPLKTEEMYEILIELSSPLTGYLGRIKGENWRGDRFYFLRDLPITQT